MIQVFRLSTPPPTTNNLFATVGSRRVRSKQYSAWADAAGWELRAQKPRKMLDDVALTIELRRPRADADVSNRIKAVEDVMTGIVYADDRQVVDVRARWADVDGVVVTVCAVVEAAE